jgi:hypothetical protein
LLDHKLPPPALPIFIEPTNDEEEEVTLSDSLRFCGSGVIGICNPMMKSLLLEHKNVQQQQQQQKAVGTCNPRMRAILGGTFQNKKVVLLVPVVQALRNRFSTFNADEGTSTTAGYLLPSLDDSSASNHSSSDEDGHGHGNASDQSILIKSTVLSSQDIAIVERNDESPIRNKKEFVEEPNKTKHSSILPSQEQDKDSSEQQDDDLTMRTEGKKDDELVGEEHKETHDSSEVLSSEQEQDNRVKVKKENTASTLDLGVGVLEEQLNETGPIISSVQLPTNDEERIEDLVDRYQWRQKNTAKAVASIEVVYDNNAAASYEEDKDE